MEKEALLTEMVAKCNFLTDEIDSFTNKSNKAAQLRARKLTLELDKLFKTFRKESVKW